jgi:hypothetical protein
VPVEEDQQQEDFNLVEASSPAVDESDRRVFPRVPASELPSLLAQFATGATVRLIDISKSGARLETDRRMLPNATISLRLVASDAAFVIKGTVVRSRLFKMSDGGLGYDVAVAFNEPLQQLPVLDEAANRLREPELPDLLPELPPDPHWEPATLAMTVNLTSSGEQLLDVFNGSNW